MAEAARHEVSDQEDAHPADLPDEPLEQAEHEEHDQHPDRGLVDPAEHLKLLGDTFEEGRRSLLLDSRLPGLLVTAHVRVPLCRLGAAMSRPVPEATLCLCNSALPRPPSACREAVPCQ